MKQISKTEYLSQRSVEDLMNGLNEDSPINYSQNGSRSISAKKFLKTAQNVAKKIGVTRIANLARMSQSESFVYQSCRPNVFVHTRYGQNTGSQGKGLTFEQSVVSCLMETIEGYCHEPRNPDLIRSSFNFLKYQHNIVNPKIFYSPNRVKINLNEPLVWTPAFNPKTNSSVLIPAESVYFPFIPALYETKSYFSNSSNGLASGTNYLEATIHALYECIERHYEYLFIVKLAACVPIPTKEIPKKVSNSFKKFDGVNFHYFLNPKMNNLPSVFCLIEQDGRSFEGFGCSGTKEISIERAYTEAIQSLSTWASGSREDLNRTDEDIFILKRAKAVKNNSKQNVRNYKLINKKFKSLLAEYKFIINWLQSHGFEDIYIANLTRKEIDIPVVKAIIPSMQYCKDMYSTYETDYLTYIKCFFPNIHYGIKN